MPVIIRETRIIAGEKVENAKVYKMGNPTMVLTQEAREQADRLDRFLEEKLGEIRREMLRKGLLRLKGRSGVLPLWHEVGRRLNFVEDPSLVPVEDRKWIWRAIYDHAGELAPHASKAGASARQMDVHFRHCYFIGKYPWDFVQRAGTWGAWWEFFYSKVIREDDRILDWIGMLQEKTRRLPRDWLRKLTRAIRHDLREIDTSVFLPGDLRAKLDMIYEGVFLRREVD